MRGQFFVGSPNTANSGYHGLSELQLNSIAGALNKVPVRLRVLRSSNALVRILLDVDRALTGYLNQSLPSEKRENVTSIENHVIYCLLLP